MTKVFIGGSRAVLRLDAAIREKLDDLMRRECPILIGDANGADKAVQQYLAERGYGQVTVYCMSRPRNNVGGWPTRAVESPRKTKDFGYYALKDAAMARDAQCGVMLWDGASKGTLNNILNLLGAGKKTLVYLSTTGSFAKLASEAELERLLESCNPRQIAAAHRQVQRHKGEELQMTLKAGE